MASTTASHLLNVCLLRFANILQWTQASTGASDEIRDEISALRDGYMRLRLLADELDSPEGQLDLVLNHSRYLHETAVLLLCNLASCLSSGLGSDEDTETCQALQKAYTALQNTVCPPTHEQFQDNLNYGSSNESVFDELLEALDLLFDLAPELQDILQSLPGQEDEGLSSTVKFYRLLIQDKFPEVKPYMALRLAGGNEECHVRLRTRDQEPSIDTVKGAASPDSLPPRITQSDSRPDIPRHNIKNASDSIKQEPGKPRNVTLSFKDSGIGSSTLWSAPPRSVNSIDPSTSSSINERLAIPIPIDAYAVEGFVCPVCENHQKPLSNRHQWTKHLYGDIKPYMCILEDCGNGNRSYASMQEWMRHMFSHGSLCIHSETATFANCCSDSKRGFEQQYRHLAHHMEDVRVLTVPPSSRMLDEAYFDSDSDSADNPEEDSRNHPDTRQFEPDDRERAFKQHLRAGEPSTNEKRTLVNEWIDQDHRNSAPTEDTDLMSVIEGDTSEGSHHNYVNLVSGATAFPGNPSTPNTTSGGPHSYESSHLNILPYAAGAAYNSMAMYKAECLRDTRVYPLQNIDRWINDPNGTCIYWLSGIAGSGKSTIARTVALTYDKKGWLGASFFFNSRGEHELRSSDLFVTTVAHQLASKQGAVSPHILEAIENYSGISSCGLREQWNRLVLQPLQKMQDSTRTHIQPLVFVFDAMNECGDEAGIGIIIQLMATAQDIGNTTIRPLFFVTSTPETPIRLGFPRMYQFKHHSFPEIREITRDTHTHDISIFLRMRLQMIYEERYDDSELSSGWPGEDKISALCEKAHGLFVYASTVCGFLEDTYFNPDERLSIILRVNNTAESYQYKALDNLYTIVLENSVLQDCKPNEVEQSSAGFRRIVGAIVIMFDALSPSSLSWLLDIPLTEITRDLKHLHSVLGFSADTDPVRLLHPSFHDFLVDKRRCLRKEFWVDEKRVHFELFCRCLERMKESLKKDICDVCRPSTLTSEVPSTAVEEHIPEDVQYACQHWINHFLESGNEPLDDGKIHQFLKTYFLFWLEALSLMGKIAEGIDMLQTLDARVMGNSGNSNAQHLCVMISDMKRFCLTDRSIIERAPLQIYYSALAFSSSKSITRRLFNDHIPVAITQVEGQTSEGHSDSITSLSFSPDGHLLASASDDRTIRLWDAVTGELHSTLEAHSGSVTAVAFSSDGQFLASASTDCTVRLWGPATGALHNALVAHSRSVIAVAFSPDGQFLASASDDHTVRLWDPSTGAVLSTLEGHFDSTTAVAFSPDGQFLASASHDRTVRLWDPSTGVLRSTLEGHSESITALAFSADGQLLASASHDRTLRLWNAKARQEVQQLPTKGLIRRLSFSADSSYLETDQGSMELRDGGGTPLSSCPISIHGEWIALGTEDTIWLPVEQRALVSAVRYGLLAMGHASGRVTFLAVDPKKFPGPSEENV